MEQSKVNYQKKRFFTFIILVTSVALFGCSKRTAENQQNIDSPLIFEKNHLDVGDINEGESKAGVIQLTNRGTSPMVIEKVTASCGCTSAKVEPDLIPPGGTGKLSVQLSAQGRRGKFGSQVNLYWAEKAGSRSGKCTAIITGNALYIANLSPTNFDFGAFSKASSPKPQTLELSRGTQALPFTDITVGSPSDSIPVEIQKISDQKWSIAACVLPDKLYAGPLLASITLIFRDVNGSELIRREVPARGEIKGLVTARPKSIYLGVLKEGESKKGVIHLKVPYGKSTKLKSIHIEPDNNCIRFDETNPIEDTQEISVPYIVHHTGKPGNLSGRVIFEFADKELGEIAVPLILYRTGDQPPQI